MRLSEYLQRHVFDVVSVKDATFHLDQREDLRARKVKAWVRTDQGLEEEKNPVFQDPCYWVGHPIPRRNLFQPANLF